MLESGSSSSRSSGAALTGALGGRPRFLGEMRGAEGGAGAGGRLAGLAWDALGLAGPSAELRPVFIWDQSRWVWLGSEDINVSYAKWTADGHGLFRFRGLFCLFCFLSFDGDICHLTENGQIMRTCASLETSLRSSASDSSSSSRSERPSSRSSLEIGCWSLQEESTK